MGLRGLHRFVLLCSCYCHEQCPLRGKEEASPEAWEHRCTCPGAPAAIRRHGEISAALAERRAKNAAEWALIKPDIGLTRGATAQTIRTDIEASLARHDLNWDDYQIKHQADVLAASLTQGPKLMIAGRILKAQYGPLVSLLRQAHREGPDATDE